MTDVCYKAAGDIPSLLNTDLPIRARFSHLHTWSVSRILLIDDADPIANKIASQFEMFGAIVERADTREKSLQIAEAFCPSAVLLDIKLKTDNGLDLIPELRELMPGSRIVVHTSYGEPSLAAWAIKAGADEFVAKPTDADLLFDILRDADIDHAVSDILSNPFSIRLRYIFETFKSNQFNVSKTARVLGLERRSLQRVLAISRQRAAISYM